MPWRPAASRCCRSTVWACIAARRRQLSLVITHTSGPEPGPCNAPTRLRRRLGVDQVGTPVPAKSRSVVQISLSTLHARARMWVSRVDPFRLATASRRAALQRGSRNARVVTGTTVMIAARLSSRQAVPGAAIRVLCAVAPPVGPCRSSPIYGSVARARSLRQFCQARPR